MREIETSMDDHGKYSLDQLMGNIAWMITLTGESDFHAPVAAIGGLLGRLCGHWLDPHTINTRVWDVMITSTDPTVDGRTTQSQHL